MKILLIGALLSSINLVYSADRRRLEDLTPQERRQIEQRALVRRHQERQAVIQSRTRSIELNNERMSIEIDVRNMVREYKETNLKGRMLRKGNRKTELLDRINANITKYTAIAENFEGKARNLARIIRSKAHLVRLITLHKTLKANNETLKAQLRDEGLAQLNGLQNVQPIRDDINAVYNGQRRAVSENLPEAPMSGVDPGVMEIQRNALEAIQAVMGR